MDKAIPFLVVMACAISCNSVPTAKNSTPQEISKNVVSIPDNKSEIALLALNDYIQFLNKEYKNCLNCTSVEMINQHELFTPYFKKLHSDLIKKSFEDAPDYGLGFDPIIDGQDCPDRLALESADSDYILLKGIDWPDYKLVVKMKLIDNSWLVDGVGVINVPEENRAKR
jgi:hypothetical protein